ncbi:MAG TPA: hypothetical protein VEX68_25095 [Bryobacteraceae bacterium]|nr:hypothetical protein [Bryobacteraceae bacterium]
MRYVLGTFVSALTALTQPLAVLDDLEQRALLAMNGIQRAESWSAVQRNRNSLQQQLEQAIGLDSVPASRPISTFVYAPRNSAGRVPAVILLRTHVGPAEPVARLFPTAIAQLGMFVIEVDARTDHATFNGLGDGVTPQGLIQQDVRSALAYLKARNDVDPTRLALIGEGLAGSIAAAINPEISVAVVRSGAPDFPSLIKELRDLKPGQLPDSCVLVPGILRHAESQEVLSLIAPRPLLLMNAAEGPLRYATDLYRMGGEGANIHHVAESAWTSSATFIASAWLARYLLHRSDLTNFVPPANADEPLVLQLPSLEVAPKSPDPFHISEHSLNDRLGPPLPEGRFTYALNCHSGPSVYGLNGNHRVHFYPQVGINLPVTVLRPGPMGCDASRGTLIAVSDRGRSELVNDEIVQEANKRGWIVWMLDPRYIGEMAEPSEPFASVTSLLLGEHMPWRQASDIIRTLRRVGGAGSRYPTALYARGKVTALAASYVAAIASQRELEWTVLRDPVSSFREITDSPLALIPFGAFKSFDVPDLWKASRSKVHRIRSPEEFLLSEW